MSQQSRALQFRQFCSNYLFNFRIILKSLFLLFRQLLRNDYFASEDVITGFITLLLAQLVKAETLHPILHVVVSARLYFELLGTMNSVHSASAAHDGLRYRYFDVTEDVVSVSLKVRVRYETNGQN